MITNCFFLHFYFQPPAAKIHTHPQSQSVASGLQQDQVNANLNRFLIKEHVMSSQTATSETPTHQEPQPSPSPSPTHDSGESKDNPTPKSPFKRILKIGAIIFFYFTVKGAAEGIHSAFTALNGQSFFHLSAFSQTIFSYTVNGSADGAFEAFRLILVAWAGPDVIDVVGPIIGSAWRKAAVAVRQMSRAVQGKNDEDFPAETNKK
jgi:hypothetical protein